MKLSKVFTIVLGSHLGVIGVLLFQPGCQQPQAQTSSTPSAKQNVVGRPVNRPLPVANAGDAQNRTIIRQGFDASEIGGTPQHGAGIARDNSPRFQPSRPTVQQWNVIQDSEPEVIAGDDYTVTESYTVENDMTDFNPPAEPLAVIDSGALNPELGMTTTRTYTVVKGDTLSKIAKTHGILLSELKEANSLTSNTIYPGQVFIIPSTEPGVDPKPATAPTYEATSAEVESTVYIVVPGDNLSKIAKKYGTTVSTIKSANGLTSNTIYAGQDLLIPKNTTSVSVSSDAPAPSFNSAGGVTYKVQSGDTLGKLSKRFGVTVSEIMEANGITDPRRLRAGQTIRIPSQAAIDKSYSAAPPAPRTVERAPAPAPIQRNSAPVQETAPAPQQTLELQDLERDDIPFVEVEVETE